MRAIGPLAASEFCAAMELPLIQDHHRFAVRAAVLDGKAGAEAFKAWTELVAFDDVDRDEFCILPLIYQKARSRGCNDPIMERLKGVYRQSWTRNKFLQQAAAQAVQLLTKAEIPSVLLKGIAMSVQWGDPAVSRAMRDVDILVPRPVIRRAASVLSKIGWKAKTLHVEELSESDLDWWSAAAFVREDGAELDLHWRVLPRNTSLAHVALFWAGIQAATVAGEPVHILKAEDQLYHVLLHGDRWTDGAALNSLVDAFSIVTGSNQLDWRILVNHAIRDRSLPAIAGQLQRFEDVFGAIEPVMRLIDAQRPSWLDVLVSKRYRMPHYFPHRDALCLVNFHDHRIRHPQQFALADWLAFTKSQWRLKRTWELVPEMLFRLMRGKVRLRSLLQSAASLGPRAPDISDMDGATSTSSLSGAFLNGWSGAEIEGRWTDGGEAVLAFKDSSDQTSDLPVTLVLRPFVTSQHPSLSVGLSANGVLCAQWIFSAQGLISTRLSFTIPGEVRRKASGRLLIAFEVDDPAENRNFGKKNDDRALGIFLERLRFGFRIVNDPFAQPLDFRSGANDDLLIEGWSLPETAGRWTVGKRALIAFRWLSDKQSNKTVITFSGRLLLSQMAQQIKIAVNGQEIRITNSFLGLNNDVSLQFRASPVRSGRALLIHLEILIPNPTSPASLGSSGDERELGFLLENIKIEEPL
jgi:hypothetical protein